MKWSRSIRQLHWTDGPFKASVGLSGVSRIAFPRRQGGWQLDSLKDLRGEMIRVRREMSDGRHTGISKGRKDRVCWDRGRERLAVCDPAYLYLSGDDFLWLRTGAHQGHFVTNLERNPRVCVTVGEIGGMETSGEYLCDGSQLYGSVVVFGEITIIRGDEKIKNSFLIDCARSMCRGGFGAAQFGISRYRQDHRVSGCD